MARLVEMKLSGFKELQDMLSPGKFPKRLEKHVEKATKKNALLAEGEIKRDISDGKFEANAPATIAIKGSSKPLVGTEGELFKSINGIALSWDVAVIGVLKSRNVISSQGRMEDLLSIARLVHEGATIKVTEKMRRFFFAMFRQFPKKWKPLKASTTTIVIPPRRFLESATKEGMISVYQRNWEIAVERAMSGQD